MGHYGFAPYVTVAERRRQAKKKLDKLKKQGMEVQPIEIVGRKITKTFWGNAWNDHMEKFSDFANRLPRGRTYVRNGSVCHLAITKGTVKAMVSGSSLYQVSITMNPLSELTWQIIKQHCTGEIASLIDLLAGRLSDGVMAVVCDPRQGLFPLTHEIKMSCNCPDWADMCKHIAAVLYAVGARLDHDPQQLFVLRGVDHEELVDVAATDLAINTASSKPRLQTDQLTDIFEIDLHDPQALIPIEKTPIKQARKTTSKKSDNHQPIQKRNIKSQQIFPKRITGIALRRKRDSLGLTQASLAKKLKISAATLSKWERSERTVIKPSDTVLSTLRQLW